MILFILLFSQSVLSKSEIVVWERNYGTPFFLSSLQNLTRLTEDEFGPATLVPSEKMEQGRAFVELLKGNIDVFIAAADERREQLANPIYVPLDRGLLGFRVCLVNKQASSFKDVSTTEQFIEGKLSIGLGTHWPDTSIYEKNGFEVVTSPVLDSLFNMLDNKRFDCFSRSVNEVQAEIEQYKNTNITLDENLVFIYPNGTFIYVSPKNPRLHRRLSTGVGLSIEDASYFDIFEEYFSNALLKHGIYERKLLLMENPNISSHALSSINNFGIASFVNQPLAPFKGSK